MGSAIAIDHGEKRTGFAVADALRILTQPIGTWHGPGDGDGLLDHIAGLLAERDVSTLVIGYPYNMDGTEGSRAKQVNAFIEALRARFPEVAIAKQDERLSTKEAESLLAEAGHFGDERKARRDSWSALVILRDWLAAGEPV
jgi:putative Holliday junction resolvase